MALSESPITSLTGFFRSSVVHFAAVIVIGILAYSNTFDVPFVWDDEKYIETNPMVKNPGFIFSVPDDEVELLTRDVKSTQKTRFFGYLSFHLNHRLHGLDTTGYHIVNLSIHLLNALLVYLLVRVVFRTPKLSHSSMNPHERHVAFFSALLFVTHPVQTQAVTYISQRFTSLATLFYLASLISYALFRLSLSRRRKTFFYVTGMGLCLAAMTTKEISFTLPLMITFFEFTFMDAKPFRKRILYVIPFLLTMVIIPISIVDLDKPFGAALDEATNPLNVSRYGYFATEYRVFLTYLRLLFFPIGLNLDYDYRMFSSLLDPQVLYSFMVFLGLLGAGGAVFLFFPSGRLLSSTVFWFVITLGVESSFVSLADLIFEHRLYLPSVGACVAVTLLLFMLVKKIDSAKPPARLAAYLVMISLVFATATYARNETWGSEQSLWEDVVRKAPGNPRARNNLAATYFSEGQTEKSIEQLEIALSLKPDYADANYNLGVAHLRTGNVDHAAEHFEMALTTNPGHHKARKWLNIIAGDDRGMHSLKPH